MANAVLWALEIEDGTVHDVRRTGSTLPTSERLSVSPFIRSKVLAHYDSGGGAQVSATRYDANTYLREKRRALESWQRLLARIVGAHRFEAGGVFFGGRPAIATAALGAPQVWAPTFDGLAANSNSALSTAMLGAGWSLK
jgi:hypothetical protein